MNQLAAGVWRKHALKIARAQLKDFWMALRAWRGEAARARMRGMAAGLWRVLTIWGKRRRVQKARTVTLDYLESILSPPQA